MLLVEGKCNVNLQTQDGETPLHVATRLEFAKIVKLLIESGADVSLNDASGKNPLEV